MGWFDWLKNLFRPHSQPSSEAFDKDQINQPRCMHYAFAHLGLRSLAFDDPLRCLAILSSDDSRKFLAYLLRSVEQHCQTRGDQLDFGLEDIVVHSVRMGRFPCSVVQMPEPRGITEAYFVALVLMIDPDAESLPDKPELRYFTLEKGFNVGGGPPRTVLCEWTADGTHANYGDGPPPELRAFLEAVAGRLKKE